MVSDLQHIARDTHGHIADLTLWQLTWVPLLAAEIGLSITPQHQQAILWLRDYYLTYHHFPTVRFTVKALRQYLEQPNFDSIQLHQLFPQSPLKWMSYCAGLPKPPYCL